MWLNSLFGQIIAVYLLRKKVSIVTNKHTVHTHTCTSEQGYKQQKRFIIAQAPMKSTCRDFWKMVYERECGVIVMLSDLVENEEVGRTELQKLLTTAV